MARSESELPWWNAARREIKDPLVAHERKSMHAANWVDRSSFRYGGEYLSIHLHLFTIIRNFHVKDGTGSTVDGETTGQAGGSGNMHACILSSFQAFKLFTELFVYIYCFVIMHLGAFCTENTSTLLVAIVAVLVATGLCPVAIGSV
jgi:hypothetical protein